MDGERRGDILLSTCLWAWGWAFQPLQYWHRGLSVPWRRFSRITGPYSLDANALAWLWWSKRYVVLFLHLSVSSVVSDSLRPHGPQLARLLCPWDFPWKSVAISSSRGIFLIWGSNPHLLRLLHWQWILYHCVTWENPQMHPVQFSSVQSLSCVRLFATPWIRAHQASLSITNSRSLLKLMSIESVMPSSHLILCRPLLLLSPIPPSIRVFSNESILLMRCPKCWSFKCIQILPNIQVGVGVMGKSTLNWDILAKA